MEVNSVFFSVAKIMQTLVILQKHLCGHYFSISYMKSCNSNAQSSLLNVLLS